MHYLSSVIAVAAVSLWGTAALAAAECVGPTRLGNTWNLVCAADDAGDDYYQCDYVLSVTNAQGLSSTVDASGSVRQGQSGVIIWSAIQHDGAEIMAAVVERGSCSR
ncbi:hypothetical protein FQZ97_1052020 [compost metagenome]